MKKVLLVGAGNIARYYVKVLRAMNADFDVIGRGAESCRAFTEETGAVAKAGGVAAYEAAMSAYSHAILAIDASQLSPTACWLMDHGVETLLVEKPGAISRQQMRDIVDAQKKHAAAVYIAYNRRFYASVSAAASYIEQDGGPKSLHFEFTEWPHTVTAAGLPQVTLDRWFLCNSTHVLDTAFFLCGEPEEITCLSDGAADWTKEHTRFAGAGRTVDNVYFDYLANWDAPGRWNLEVLTASHRFIFRPLEKLQIQPLRSVKMEFDTSFDDSRDTEFKPGLYGEVEAFLTEGHPMASRLKTAEEQLASFSLYEKIAGRTY